jgi:hypothetical protein
MNTSVLECVSLERGRRREIVRNHETDTPTPIRVEVRPRRSQDYFSLCIREWLAEKFLIAVSPLRTHARRSACKARELLIDIEQSNSFVDFSIQLESTTPLASVFKLEQEMPSDSDHPFLLIAQSFYLSNSKVITEQKRPEAAGWSLR